MVPPRISDRRVARGQASATARAAPVWMPWVGSTAAAELRRRGADRLVLVGSSMGGTAALEAAADAARVRAELDRFLGGG
jgi:pimeloyl-ACP methyl ester carboxylesterase